MSEVRYTKTEVKLLIFLYQYVNNANIHNPTRKFCLVQIWVEMNCELGVHCLELDFHKWNYHEL